MARPPEVVQKATAGSLPVGVDGVSRILENLSYTVEIRDANLYAHILVLWSEDVPKMLPEDVAPPVDALVNGMVERLRADFTS